MKKSVKLNVKPESMEGALYRVIEYVHAEPEMRAKGKMGRRILMFKPDSGGKAMFMAPVVFPLPNGEQVPLNIPLEADTIHQACRNYKNAVNKAGQSFYENLERNLERAALTKDGFEPVPYEDTTFTEPKALGEIITASLAENERFVVRAVSDKEGQYIMMNILPDMAMDDKMKSCKVLAIRKYRKAVKIETPLEMEKDGEEKREFVKLNPLDEAAAPENDSAPLSEEVKEAAPNA